MSIIHKFNKAVVLFRSDRATLYQRLGLYNPIKRTIAAHYLNANGVMEYLIKGAEGEYGCGIIKQVDLYNLYTRIRCKRPQNIIEFGCGYSSIAMAHALKKNHEEYGKKGKLHIVEASEKWAENVERKLAPLMDYVEIYRSTPQLQRIDGQLCHIFDRLPNVRPDMIYLDGPDMPEVQGTANGLTMKGLTFACAADPLLYEWSFYPGFFMVVDGRFSNVEFLRRNFQRKYRISRNYFTDSTVFTLIK
jgi:hypothetical protein